MGHIVVEILAMVRDTYRIVPYSPTLYEILSNKNSHYTRGLDNIYVLKTGILCQFSCLIFEVVLFLGLYGIT